MQLWLCRWRLSEPTQKPPWLHKRLRLRNSRGSWTFQLRNSLGFLSWMLSRTPPSMVCGNSWQNWKPNMSWPRTNCLIPKLPFLSFRQAEFLHTIIVWLSTLVSFVTVSCSLNLFCSCIWMYPTVFDYLECLLCDLLEVFSDFNVAIIIEMDYFVECSDHINVIRCWVLVCLW